MTNISNRKIYVLMVFTALFWSGAFITGKMAVQEFPPFALTFFRFLFTLPFIFAILYSRQPGAWLPGRVQWGPLVILGFVGTFLYHVLFFFSLHYTSAVNSSLIGASNPMMTAVLAALFLRDRLDTLRLLGIALSFSGVVLTITGGDWSVVSGFAFNAGDLFMFAAVFSWAAYAVLSRCYMQRFQLSPLMITAYTFLLCTLISFPFVLWERPLAFLPFASLGGWLSILYMAVFASVLGYLFQLIAIQRIGAPKAAIFINLVPVFTIIQSQLILGESVGWFKLFSAAVIIGGVYLTTRAAATPQTGCATGGKQ
ncbi:DMT family transporter [Propionispora sp. 2/2-37]|uniref:DMT family transporter n=1 Tax=Propionispora sp. 2/2-37 TaxID=1677858 RepID=UPI001F4493B0|nr:DMT family transporter [Propionispora sp. 2/2-37]